MATKRRSKPAVAKSKEATSHRSSSKPAKSNTAASVFGLAARDYVGIESGEFSGDGLCGYLLVLGGKVKVDSGKLAALVREFHIDSGWHLEHAAKKLNNGQAIHLGSSLGPIWVVSLKPTAAEQDKSHGSMMQNGPHGLGRDRVGSAVAHMRDFELAGVNVQCIQATDDEGAGVVLGLTIGSYCYVDVKRGKKTIPFYVSGCSKAAMSKGRALGESMNIARHLVNTPAGDLNPKTYAETVEALFASSPEMSVEVWDTARITKEKMGLLLAVGVGSVEGPCLVRMSYRPAGSGKKTPIAFVGKGVTFDSGGLDIKPPSGMRLMKKDMGGSASAVGLAWWLTQARPKQPCDIYLAIAENSVDAKSFRPGDVITARNGMSVEIHNTDAEGRLVLADALDVAATREGADKPSLLIDMATLTGAMRVALGTVTGGMFATDDALAKRLEKSSINVSDPIWRLPLARDCERDLKSTVADMANAGSSGMGGAISAALFLQKFTRGLPWAHFDIYCWADSVRGGFNEVGGNGQAIQLLADYISDL